MAKAKPTLPPEFRPVEAPGPKRPPGRTRIEEQFAEKIEKTIRHRFSGWQTLKTYQTRSAALTARRRLAEAYPYELTNLEFVTIPDRGRGADLYVRLWTDAEREEAKLAAERAAEVEQFATKYERALAVAQKAAEAPQEPSGVPVPPSPEIAAAAHTAPLVADLGGRPIEDPEPLAEAVVRHLVNDDLELPGVQTVVADEIPSLSVVTEEEITDEDAEFLAMFESTQATEEDKAILATLEAEERSEVPPFAPKFGLGR